MAPGFLKILQFFIDFKQKFALQQNFQNVSFVGKIINCGQMPTKSGKMRPLLDT